MTTVYDGFNDTHLTEKLREWHGLRLCRESVRRLRRRLGRPPARPRRAPRARRRRLPEAPRGALVQIDGSPFVWFGNRGPELTLLGAVDDATTEILALHFRPAEDVYGYATLFQHLFVHHGLPLAFYGDRLNLLIRNDAHWSLEEQLAGRQSPTHLAGRPGGRRGVRGPPHGSRHRSGGRSAAPHAGRAAPCCRARRRAGSGG